MHCDLLRSVRCNSKTKGVELGILIKHATWSKLAMINTINVHKLLALSLRQLMLVGRQPLGSGCNISACNIYPDHVTPAAG